MNGKWNKQHEYPGYSAPSNYEELIEYYLLTFGNVCIALNHNDNFKYIITTIMCINKFDKVK